MPSPSLGNVWGYVEDTLAPKLAFSPPPLRTVHGLHHDQWSPAVFGHLHGNDFLAPKPLLLLPPPLPSLIRTVHGLHHDQWPAVFGRLHEDFIAGRDLANWAKYVPNHGVGIGVISATGGGKAVAGPSVGTAMGARSGGAAGGAATAGLEDIAEEGADAAGGTPHKK